MDVAFIGIGSMGAAMVPHLVHAGHRVSVWNRNPAASEAVAGVTVLATPAAAFDNDVVMTMLADDKAVRAVVVDSGALKAAREGCVHVMMATISPALVDELVELHRDAGVGYVAAPVFGVPAAAAKAQLNIVVAGDEAAIARVQPLLDVLGQKTWPLGDDPKRANVAKIAGNLMITLAIEAMGEASALTESYGVKAADFLNIVTNTLFASPSYQRYGGFIGSDTYEPGFKLTLGLKDVNLALDAAEAKGATLPSAQIVRGNMLEAIDQGMGAKDWSILAKIARRRAGLDDSVA
jgi:3-hydroxyisobutyrate dehydrogenase-like beta-hydroxyacid dehydrogenase